MTMVRTPPSPNFLLTSSHLDATAHIQQPQINESTLIAMQHHMAQQAAFSQIPDAVRSVS